MATQIELTPRELDKRLALSRKKPLVYKKVLKYSDKLQNGESVAIVQLQWDYICNFNCQHCSIVPFKKVDRRKLSLEEVKDLANQIDALGLGHIDITGGEPTVFKDLDNLLEAIDPKRFYIQCDSNGFLFDFNTASHWKQIGIDKVHLSIDSLDPQVHDTLRNKQGSWQRVVDAIGYANMAGLDCHVCTVVDKNRIRSQELKDFIQFINDKGAPVSMMFAKPIGAWQGRSDLLLSQEDVDYARSLENKYWVFNHLTKSFGNDVGCIAVKRMVSINRFGDVMPAPCMQLKIGNIFETPLKDIIEKGMKVFKHKEFKCISSQSGDFINRYLEKTKDRELPIPIEDMLPL
jgi:MoaA/NifB/PqqE/SkfB family radical SAM enzyme